jgi:hypothetical protein
MHGPYVRRMRMLVKPILCACLGAATLAGAAAVHAVEPAQDSGQDMARQHRQNGTGLSIRDIERRVIPRMPGAQYLGFDYDPATDIYTLKFLRNGSVIWVNVEGRTARILSRRGS